MLNVFCELSRAIRRSMFDLPSLLSTNFCTKGEKHAFARALDNADFRSPYGRELSKILRHGVGIHHRHPRCVGVNVPIRTVMENKPRTFVKPIAINPFMRLA